MRLAWIVLAGSLAAAADVRADDRAYWNRVFEPVVAYRQSYVVDLIVQKIPEASDHVLRVVKELQGEIVSPVPRDCGNYCVQTYAVPLASCDKFAKELEKVGSVRNLSIVAPNKFGARDDDELEARIAALRSELSANGGVLEKMPAVRALAVIKLRDLEAVLAARRRSDVSCEARVTLRR